MKTSLHKTYIIFIIVFSLTIVPSMKISYATMLGISTQKLTQDSDLIIDGTVIDVYSAWDETSTTIYTYAVVEIQNIHKGSSENKNVTLMYRGGEVDNIGLKISDQAEFKKRENVFLFLKKSKKEPNLHMFQITGKAQGKYSITKDNRAVKKGFSVAGNENVVDYDIPVDLLIEEVRKYK